MALRWRGVARDTVTGYNVLARIVRRHDRRQEGEEGMPIEILGVTPEETEQLRAKARAARRRKMLVYGGSGGGAIAAAFAVYFFFFAVVVYKTVEEALAEIQKRHPAAQISRDPASGYVTTLSNLEESTRRGEPVPTAAAGGFAIDFVARPEVAAALGVPREADLKVATTNDDPQLAEYDLVRIQQYIDKVRIFGAEIAVSVRKGPSAAISTVTTRPALVPELDLTPAIGEAQGRATAIEHYAVFARDPARRLPREAAIEEIEQVLFDPARFGLDGSAALVWRARLGAVHVFVDARDGRVVLSYDDRPTARNRQTHDCQTSDCPLVLNEQGPVQPVPPIAADAKRVHDAAAAAHAYFQNTFQRDGYDDTAGTGGKASINMFVQVPGLKNAHWDRHGEGRFNFGPGWATLDIAAHEYTHAVTTFGSALEPLGQAGAVSEFFSDFFGIMIDRSVTGIFDWRIGEGLPGHSAAKPLRNLVDPHNGGFNRDANFDPITNAGQPQEFGEVVRPSHAICASFGGDLPDNGCVHFNGGILSKALHLASAGGSFKGTAVTAIASSKIEQIMFRTLTSVTSSSNLLDTANIAVRGCREIIGQFGIRTNDCTALRTAFVAVKMPVAP